MTDPQPTEPPRAESAGALRPIYFSAGLLLVGLGVIGAFLPVMPSTIFFILAVACFARSSPKLENWLLTHPRFGPPIIAWRKTGAIPFKVKLIAIGSMAVSMTIVCLSPAPVWVDWLVAMLLGASALFIGTRRGSPRPAPG